MPLHRYRWEQEGGRRGPGERRLAMLRIDRVEAVRSRGVGRPDGGDDAVLSVLAITFSADNKEAGASGRLRMICSGGAEIDLAVECLEVRLTDADARWQAGGRPRHDLG